MPAPSHYLKRNEGEEAPWRWLFFDTETRSEQVGPRRWHEHLAFGWALLWARGRPSHPEQLEWFRFVSASEFLDLVRRLATRKSRLILCAHNLGFDATTTELPETLWQLGWSVPYFIEGNGPTLFKFTCDGASIMALDSHNWFPFSLREIGNWIKLPKMEQPAAGAPADEWDTYCKRDVEIVYHAVRRWLSEVQNNHLGNFAWTLPAQAMNCYRHRFMIHKLVVDTDKEQLALARRGYYGGRAEVYHLGKLPPDHYTLLDINSMYLSEMAKQRFPAAPVATGKGWPADERNVPRPFTSLIAEVELDTPAPLYPLHVDGRLLFPVGKFRTVLAGPELRLASSRRHVVRMGRWVAYRMEPIFAEVAQFFFDRRLACTDAGDTLSAALYKRMGVALHGKFGQRSPVWVQVAEDRERPFGSWDEYNLDRDEWSQFKTIGGVVYKAHAEVDAPLAIPSIAAFTTSYGRVRLLELIEQAEWENVFRVDTDSLLVNTYGRNLLHTHIDPQRMGALKIEDEGDEVVNVGQKATIIDGRRRVSGLKQSATLLPDGTYEEDDFWGIQRNWRSGLRGVVVVERVRKHLPSEYHAGQVAEDGAITPVNLDDTDPALTHGGWGRDGHFHVNDAIEAS